MRVCFELRPIGSLRTRWHDCRRRSRALAPIHPRRRCRRCRSSLGLAVADGGRGASLPVSRVAPLAVALRSVVFIVAASRTRSHDGFDSSLLARTPHCLCENLCGYQGAQGVPVLLVAHRGGEFDKRDPTRFGTGEVWCHDAVHLDLLKVNGCCRNIPVAVCSAVGGVAIAPNTRDPALVALVP